MPKVSVIIPIYNNEKYIGRCLDSLLAQTLKDIQVLMINDGSVDRTEEICQGYAALHPNFEYHYKENGGSASARNVGLEHATGEYIGFVDSDDYVEPDMFEKLYHAAVEHGGADMVFNPMKDKASFTTPVPGFYDRKGMEEYIFQNLLPYPTKTGTFRSFDWGNWSKLIRRDVIEKNHIRYYDKSRRCEDLCFAFECTVHSNTYVVLPPEELYHYCISENSKSRHYTKNMWRSIGTLMRHMAEVVHAYPDYDFTEKLKGCILYFCVIVIKNEVFGPRDGKQKEKIQAILDDELCRDALNLSATYQFNKEYTAIFQAMGTGSAAKVNTVIKWYAWKKQYAAPILAKLRRG
jgi:glycosyltransferase involved in cell wall biosynthesis